MVRPFKGTTLKPIIASSNDESTLSVLSSLLSTVTHKLTRYKKGLYRN